MATDLYEGWDHRRLGSATMTLTDSLDSYVLTAAHAAGAPARYAHLDLSAVNVDARDAATVDTGFSDYASALDALKTFAGGDAVTWTFDPATLAYTIANVEVGATTLELTFPATAAGRLMRRILGFTDNKTGALSYTSDCRPWFVMRAQIDGRAAYDIPAAIPGQVKVARAGTSLYTLAPSRLVKATKWEHRFEPPAAVSRLEAVPDTTVGGASWTWEDWMDHASSGVPCVIKDTTRSMVFRTSMPFEKGMQRRRKMDAEPQQTVTITADVILGTL